MERKIVSVSVSANTGASTFLAIAMADDGTAWKIRLDNTDGEIGTEWMRLPPLPTIDQFEGDI